MKKFLIYLLIFFFLNLVGCYYQEQMTPGDYKFDEDSKIWVTTKDTSYQFNGKDYYLKNDTLIGQQSKKLDKITTQYYDVAIPLEDIISVEIERHNSEETLLIVLSILVGILAVVAIIELNNLNFSSKN